MKDARYLKVKEETSEIPHLGHSFVWYWKLNYTESGSETFEVLKCGSDEEWKDQCNDNVKNRGGLKTVKEERNSLHTIKRRRLTGLVKICVGTTLQNTLPRERQGTGRWGRRRKQPLNDLKETRGYRKLEEDALNHTLCRTRFGRGCGPGKRQCDDNHYRHHYDDDDGADEE